MAAPLLLDEEPSWNHFEGEARWVAVLSDGTYAVQNDEPGLSSWPPLGKYCSERKLRIRSFYVQFRGNRWALPPDAHGYYFAIGAGTEYPSMRQDCLFIVGHYDGLAVHIERLRTPELLPVDLEERPVDKCGNRLFLNK